MCYGNSENSFMSFQDLLYLRNYKCECIAELKFSFKLLTANNVPFDLPTNESKSKHCPSYKWFHLKV